MKGHLPDSVQYRCSSGLVWAIDACSCTRCKDCGGWGHGAPASYTLKPTHTKKTHASHCQIEKNTTDTHSNDPTLTQNSLTMSHSDTYRIVADTHIHSSYPVVESRRPIWSSGEVIDSVVASMTWIQEQTDVLNVVLYRWLHPLRWEGHDYTHTHKNVWWCLSWKW